MIRAALRGWPCSDVAIAHGEHDERDEDAGEDDRGDGTDDERQHDDRLE